MGLRVVAVAGVFAFLADQITKYLVIHAMKLSLVRSIDVLPPVLNFRYGENTGINFGLFEGSTELTRWILIGFSLLVCAIVLVWVLRGARPKIMHVSAGLLIGGALGNVLDRVLYGYVLDFLNMSCCGINNPFVFNVADIFIFVGAAGLIVFDRPAKKGA